MVFESLVLLFREFVNSDVGVETALCVHLLENLDPFAGLLFMVHGVMETNLLEVTGASRVEIPVLGHEITHAKTLVSPWAKTSIKRGVKFAHMFQPITWENGIIIIFIAMCSVSGEQINHADEIFVSLRKIKFIVSVIVWPTLEKRSKTNGFVLSIDLTRFS